MCDHNTCIVCGESIPTDDVMYDPDTNEGPYCPVCIEEQGTNEDFDFGEQYEQHE